MATVTLSTTAGGAISFEDASDAAGMKGGTESWGASWGDINGDNWPDLFNQGHRAYPRLYRNTGEGTFQDIAYEVDPGDWIADPFNDQHGAVWVNFDNDNDQDLLISVASTGDAQLLRNRDGLGNFVNRSTNAQINEDALARHAAFFDFNNDGHLDVAQAHTENAFLRERDPDDATAPNADFDDAELAAGWNCPGRMNYIQLADIDGSGPLEVFCIVDGPFPTNVYNTATLPFTDITGSLPLVTHVIDTVAADFNNDLRTDMILTRGALRPSAAVQVDTHRIESWLRKGAAVEPGKGFTFESAGPITVSLDYKGIGIYDESTVFELDTTTNTSAILYALEESPEGSLQVEWLAGENIWQVTLIETNTSFEAYVQIDTTEPVSNLTETAFDIPEAAFPPAHLENVDGTLIETVTSGLDIPMYCVSVVAGDFDNDMDQDLYMVCRRGPENLSNRLFENQGDGTFVEVLAHGAEGPTGIGPDIGVGESVVVADYDVDGYLDLYVTNGLLFYPINEGGPDKLFRNTGSGNNWMEIDLYGTTSNRDGIGAKVTVTAGGVSQIREQNGGYHRWSQNHQRLHFGLGSNTSATVTVEWPSGTVDTYTWVAANRLYKMVEGKYRTRGILGPPVYTTPEAGDECWEPGYNQDYGPAILLWKNCSSGTWSLRVKGGRSETLQVTDGQLLADVPLTGVTPVDLSDNDSYNNDAAETLEFNLNTWFANSEGFDFKANGASSACLTLNVQDIDTFILGGSQKQISGGIDLITLEACALPPPVIGLAECGEPTFDHTVDNGLFAWRDCNHLSASTARWNFVMSGGTVPWQPYPAMINSDVVLSAVGANLEANDVLDSVPNDNEIDYDLKVGPGGKDEFRVDFPLDGASCVGTDDLPPGTPVIIGESGLPQSASFDPLTMEECTVGCHP